MIYYTLINTNLKETNNLYYSTTGAKIKKKDVNYTQKKEEKKYRRLYFIMHYQSVKISHIFFL